MKTYAFIKIFYIFQNYLSISVGDIYKKLEKYYKKNRYNEYFLVKNF